MTAEKGKVYLGDEVKAVVVGDQSNRKLQNKTRRGSVVRRTSWSTSQIEELKEEDSKILSHEQATDADEKNEPDVVSESHSVRSRQNLAYWSAAESFFASFKHKQSFRSRKRGSYVFLADEISPNPLMVKGTSSSFKHLEALFFAPKPDTKGLHTESAAQDPRTSSTPNPGGNLPHSQVPNAELLHNLKEGKSAGRENNHLDHSRRPMQERIRSKVVAGGRHAPE
jgi:hypothetical protein